MEVSEDQLSEDDKTLKKE
jgi:hypothetical protein